MITLAAGAHPLERHQPKAAPPDVVCSDDAYDTQLNGYNIKNLHRIVAHGGTAPME